MSVKAYARQLLWKPSLQQILRGRFVPIPPSFVTHSVTHNKKGPNGKPLSPCFKWSGREDLNLRPPAPKAGALARLRHAPILVHSKIYNRLL